MTGLEAPTADQLLTLGTLSFLVTVLTEVIMRAWRPDADLKDRVGPLLAIGLGVIIAVLVGLNRSADLAQAAVTGLYAGLASMGFYKGVKTLYEKAV